MNYKGSPARMIPSATSEPMGSSRTGAITRYNEAKVITMGTTTQTCQIRNSRFHEKYRVPSSWYGLEQAK